MNLNRSQLKKAYEEGLIDEKKYKDELFKFETTPKRIMGDYIWTYIYFYLMGIAVGFIVTAIYFILWMTLSKQGLP